MTYVLTESCQSYLTFVNKFYSKAESKTGHYIDSKNVYLTDTLGFYFQSYYTYDQICVGSGNITSLDGVCYMGEIYAVQQV